MVERENSSHLNRTFSNLVISHTSPRQKRPKISKSKSNQNIFNEDLLCLKLEGQSKENMINRPIPKYFEERSKSSLLTKKRINFNKKAPEELKGWQV